MTGKHHFTILILLLLSLLAASVLLAQDDPQPAPLTLTGVNPQRVTAGQSASVSLSGSGFTEDTRARIGSTGEIDPDFISDSTLTMALPPSLGAGSYSISVSNPDGSSANLPNALNVEDPPTPTVPPITISQVEPQRLTAGQQTTLSILGSGFTPASVVRVVGAGLLQTTYVNSGALTAVVPGTLAAGRHTVEVSDPNGSAASLPDVLTVVNPPPPATQPPPTAQPAPTATPIIVVNKPSLALTNFVAQPSVIEPGQTVNLTFTVTNLGTQAARTIIISLGSGSSFVPAGGQSSLTLPDLGPGAAWNSQMAVSVALDVANGPVRIPLALTYQDQAGESYTTNAELSVTVRSVVSNSQIIIDAYTADPSPAEPGQPVTVRMTVANVGNKIASQVSVRFNGSANVLLPNGSGDTFVIGDLQPGQRVPLQAPLIVSTEAKNGPQVQPIVISYIQDGEAKESSTTMTVNVAEINQPQPLLLLSRYTTSEDVLQPGSRFTLGVTLQNAGAADARSVMITFGTVETSGDSGGDSGSGGSGSQSTTPSTTFAPLGTAGLAYVGDIAAGSAVEVDQEFLITGSVNTGIYNLPVTLQHILADGTVKQSALNVSLVVIVPPRLRVTLAEPLPEMANTGEPFPLMLELVNDGRTDLNLTTASVEAGSAEVVDGAETRLERIKSEDDTRLNALIVPQEEGTVDITVTIHYLNDLNQPGSIVHTYSLQAVMPPPPVEEPIDPGPVVVPPEPEVDWFGQALMALLGLGS